MRRHGLSADAKKAIAGIIATMELGDSKPWDFAAYSEGVGDFRKRFERLGDEVPFVLEEIIGTGGLFARVFASVVSLGLAVKVADFETSYPTLIRAADDIITNAVRVTKDPQKLRFICTLIGGTGTLPRKAAPALLRLLKHESEIIRVSAASALCSNDEFRPSAISVIGGLLHSDAPEVLFIAAMTCILQQVRQEEAISALVRAFRESRGEVQFGMVRLLHDLGPRAKNALPTLSDLVRNNEVPAYLRGRAAAAIGNITRDEPEAAKLLKKALRSRNWEVVMGAADGLALTGCIGDEEVAHLATSLSAEDDNLRGAAAYGLKKFGPRAAAAIPAMIARIGTESSRDVCHSLINAFEAMGSIVVMPLLDLLADGDMRQLPMIVASLRAVGSAAAETIAELMLPYPDDVVRCVGVDLLRELGRNAAPAVPALAKLLDEAKDAERAYEIIAAIALCGHAAHPAVEALTRALIRWDEDVAEIAEHSLRLIGTPALAALEAAQHFADGEAKQRMVNAIAAIGPKTSKAFKRLEGYQRDDLLRLFVLVGEIFEQQGETSWHRVAKEVSTKITFKRANGMPFGTTDKSIAKAVNDLGAIVLGKNVKPLLTTHGSNTKGELTPAGMKLLREAREYLDQKYGSDLGNS